MGAEVFHGRVRDGIGCIILAMTTGPPRRILGIGVGVWEWLGGCGVRRGLVLRAVPSEDGVALARMGDRSGD
jgi:hypothetical protein